jgi:hypothetical protein
VMKVSDNPRVDEIEPEFKYIANMHGDEIAGREFMVHFLEDLCEGYQAGDKKIIDLIESTEIFVMPSMNPDGAATKRRGNANWADLNRDFPDFNTSDDTNTWSRREPETQAVMKWQADRNFSLSANFHGGAVVVNYPWDGTHAKPPHEDDLKSMSLDYASKVPEMANSTQFKNGIVKGADWYIVNGGMQDWSWYWYEDIQLTIELTNIKWPSYSSVQPAYSRNKESLFDFVNHIHRGFGFKSAKIDLASADIKIFKVDKSTQKEVLYSTSKMRAGERYIVAAPGDYRIEIAGKSFEHTVLGDVDPTATTYYEI